MPLTFTQRLTTNPDLSPHLTLPLTAEERQRSRARHCAPDGQVLELHLPRGTVLQDGDWLESDTGELLLQIQAQPEPVLTVRADTPLALLQAAYHLGNRHVPLEITPTYLRLSPDPVLETMLNHMGLAVIPETHPFHPEPGAYGHHP